MEVILDWVVGPKKLPCAPSSRTYSSPLRSCRVQLFGHSRASELLKTGRRSKYAILARFINIEVMDICVGCERGWEVGPICEFC